jgi:hypothetical protein
VNEELEALIVRLAKENPSLGYEKLQGELEKLGYDVGISTVRDVLKRHDILPAPERDYRRSPPRKKLNPRPKPRPPQRPGCLITYGRTIDTASHYRFCLSRLIRISAGDPRLQAREECAFRPFQHLNTENRCATIRGMKLVAQLQVNYHP